MTGTLVLDLFAGPGGWDEGLRLAGHTGRVVGVELDRWACATGQAAGHQRVRADVAAFPLGHLAGQVRGVIASPPCPSFSTAGQGGGKLDTPSVMRLVDDFAAGRTPGDHAWRDDRSALTAQPMRAVVALRPEWVALEQVPPVLPIWQWLAHRLRELGYSVWCGLLSSEEYGVPQTRVRAVLIASQAREALPPPATHQAYEAGRSAVLDADLFGEPLPPPVSMAEALGWAVAPRWRLRNGTQDNACTRSPDEPAGTLFFGGRGNAVDWVLRTGNNSEQAGGLEPYSRPLDAPAPTLDTQVGSKWTVHDRGGPELALYRRGNAVDWAHDRPATTVCADSRVGRPGHKDRDQGERQFERGSVRVTVEEAAILQGFRRDYPWRGTKTARYAQVGNAVPPPLAAAVLRQLLETG